LFKFGLIWKRRSLDFEGETYHIDRHSNYKSSISLEQGQVAVIIEAIKSSFRSVDQYEIHYSKKMIGKEHILLLLLLFYDRRVVAKRASSSNGYGSNHSIILFDKLAHRAHWRPEDDETIE